MKKGKLIVVGTGIQLGHVCILAKSYMESCDKLLYVVTDDITEKWIKKLNPSAETLLGHHKENTNRRNTYNLMIDKIIENVRKGLKVCVAFYGHPGVFVYAGHKSIELAKKEGYTAEMMPGVSAEDCLFADLGIDPAIPGCQSFEATDMLLYKRKFDTRSHLIIWQAGVVGNLKYTVAQNNHKAFDVFRDYLLKFYPPTHNVTIYIAARIATAKPYIKKIKLAKLQLKDVDPIVTLYIPPVKDGYADSKMIKMLGLAES
jgi:uncharacterized protein YabN with tetrapyrrole methylase and pyrophosphatase domain